MFSSPFIALMGTEHYYMSSYEAEKENNEQVQVIQPFFFPAKGGKNDEF